MTGLLILTFIPAAAAFLFWLRVREQRREIDALRARLAGAPPAVSTAIASEQDLFGTLAHELRSPIAAILGYEELLSEGVLGPLDARTAEALGRIRSSALQLLALTDGMHVLSGRDSGTPDLGPLDFSAALADARMRATGDAQARRITFDEDGGDAAAITGQGNRGTVDAILDAVLGAALKCSSERTLRTTLDRAGDRVRIRVHNTGIAADALEDQPLATGVGLRLMIAREMARRLGGDVRLSAAGDLPPRAATGAAARAATIVDVDLPHGGTSGQRRVAP